MTKRLSKTQQQDSLREMIALARFLTSNFWKRSTSMSTRKFLKCVRILLSLSVYFHTIAVRMGISQVRND